MERGRETAPYYSAAWRSARRSFLSVHPVCPCGATASVVDHVRPHRGKADLFWDEGNWQALCWSCHSRKTATQDHGFGHG